jgi:hypothetical protein
MPDRCEGGRTGLKQSFRRWPAQSRGCPPRTCTALGELARWLAGSSALPGTCLKWVLRTITDGNLSAAGKQSAGSQAGGGGGGCADAGVRWLTGTGACADAGVRWLTGTGVAYGDRTYA